MFSFSLRSTRSLALLARPVAYSLLPLTLLAESLPTVLCMHPWPLLTLLEACPNRYQPRCTTSICPLLDIDWSKTQRNYAFPPAIAHHFGTASHSSPAMDPRRVGARDFLGHKLASRLLASSRNQLWCGCCESDPCLRRLSLIDRTLNLSAWYSLRAPRAVFLRISGRAATS